MDSFSKASENYDQNPPSSDEFASCDSELQDSKMKMAGSKEYHKQGNDVVKNGNWQTASEYYKKAIECGFKMSELWVDTANLYKAMGNIFQALQDCRKALELDCNCPRAHKTMGILLTRLGAISHVREHFGMPDVNVTEEEMEALLLIENNVKSDAQERASRD